MKRITIVCLIYMFGLNLNLLSQWEPDIRLTNDPAYSFTKSYYNHTNNLAVKNNIDHTGSTIYYSQIEQKHELIDPQQVWATYYGNTGCEGGFGIATDLQGNVIVTGMTSSTAFPISGAFQPTLGGSYDAFIIKFNPSGQRLWATYYGGSGFDRGMDVKIDNNNDIIITGDTYSSNFPLTSGAFQPANGGGSDMFMIKFNSSGQRLWATYYGGSGSDYGVGCAVNSNGDIFCTGFTSSINFPVTTGAYQGNNGGEEDAFIVCLNSSGQRVWATYYGGSLAENISILEGGICTDNNGDVIITGSTRSSNFPVTTGAFQTNLSGFEDAFIVKFNSAGQRQWATYFGGSSGISNAEGGSSITTDYNGNIIVFGNTASTDLPVSPGAFQPNYAGGGPGYYGDAFLLKLDPSGQRLWATYYGGSLHERAFSVATSCGSDIVVTGQTSSLDFPVTPGTFQPSLAGVFDAFIAKFSSSGQRIWASYYGGNLQDYGESVATNIDGSLYFTGETHSTNLPVTPGAFQQTYYSCQEIFISKFDICTGCEVPNYVWEKVGNTPTELNSTVNAYCMFNNKLIAGGTFTNASGNVVNHIASWNGSIWEQLDNGLTGSLPYAEVDALTVFQNKVIAGGRFLLAGSTVANNIAQWDGNSWTSVGTGSGNGTDGRVYSLAVHNNKLIVGGVFTTAGGIPASNIAQWDGSTWSVLGSGVSGDVRSLLSFNNNLYAGGVFSTAGSVTANNIAKWDGSNWSSLGSGMTLTNGNGQGVGALADYNNNLIAAGRFDNAGGVPVNFIAKWNGSSWSDIGGGFPGSYEGIYALYVSNNALYAGGSFVTAGANNANSIAKWNGSGWSALGNGITNFSGQGIVLSLTNYNGYLFAGGEFTSPDYSWIASNLCETVIPIGIEPGNITIPKTYYLSQNYPNPFNPSTRISISLPEKSFVTLRVYDMLGREIAVLLNNEIYPGDHSINWDASAYPSGVYFYKIEAGTFVESKKMVLIK